jgi:hypothetical protein
VLNFGLTRPFHCILPEGIIVNPQFPAAVGMRSLTCGRIRSLLFRAFSQAMPERMPAAPAASSSIVNVMTHDDRTSEAVMAAINPVVGGSSGMPTGDGTDGSGADAAYLKNTPVEITEAEVPIRFRRYGGQVTGGVNVGKIAGGGNATAGVAAARRQAFPAGCRGARFFPTNVRVTASILHRAMVQRFPQLAGVRITNSWGGRVAVPRPLAFILHKTIKRVDLDVGQRKSRRRIWGRTVEHRHPEDPPTQDAKDRDQIGKPLGGPKL